MGFSFIAEALFQNYSPEAVWRPLLVRLGYPTRLLDRDHRTPATVYREHSYRVIPLLVRRNRATFVSVLRLWTVVLLANLVGAHIIALVFGNTPVFNRELQDTMRQIAIEAANVTFGTAILRGIFAGWMIAMVVWMLAASDSARVAIIVILTYTVGLAGLTHVIAGSVEVLFLVLTGIHPWSSYLTGYLIPTLIGNIIGGVALVSALNHAQVISGSSAKASRR